MTYTAGILNRFENETTQNIMMCLDTPTHSVYEENSRYNDLNDTSSKKIAS